MIVHLLRHGSTCFDGHFLGRTNPELTAEGWSKTRAQIERLAWSHIVASPLKRAQQPALEAASRAGAVCRIDDDWREMDFGTWDGRAIEDVRAEQPDAVTDFYADPRAAPPPKAEPWPDLAGRVHRALNTILADEREAPVLVITHAGAIRAALAEACGFRHRDLWAFRIAHASALTMRIGSKDGAVWGEVTALAQA